MNLPPLLTQATTRGTTLWSSVTSCRPSSSPGSTTFSITTEATSTARNTREKLQRTFLAPAVGREPYKSLASHHHHFLSRLISFCNQFLGLWLVDAAQNVSEVMLDFAPGSSELSARWRHWFNFAVALYTAKTTVLPTSRQCSPRI